MGMRCVVENSLCITTCHDTSTGQDFSVLTDWGLWRWSLVQNQPPYTLRYLKNKQRSANGIDFFTMRLTLFLCGDIIMAFIGRDLE